MVIGERRRLAAAVGWAFQNERAKRGLSQSRVATRLGVTQQWLSKVERGRAALSTDSIERLFAVLGLQVRLDVEPEGSDLDGEIEEILNLPETDREYLLWAFGRRFDQLTGVPWVVSGRLGAYLQGVPVRVSRLDLAVAETDLEAMAELFRRLGCARWNERLYDYYGLPSDPRKPGPMRWMLGTDELRLEVGATPPPSINVTFGERVVAVRPLPHIEAGYPDITRVVERVRTRVIHR